jgi:uncharacterized membrane protein YphA (DoxX/SURF4 family)
VSLLRKPKAPATRLGRFPGRRYDVVRLLLGVLLLTAGVLKGYELASGPVPETSPLTSRWLLIAVVEWELLFGAWLLAGFYPHTTRWVALTWFTLLLGVGASQAHSGARSCACFGPVQVAPWLVALLDLAALAALWMVRPSDPSPHPPFSLRSHPTTLAAFFLVVSLVAVPAAWAMWNVQPRGQLLEFNPSKLDLGTIRQGEYGELNFWLSNPGHSPVEITALESSCPCLQIELEKGTILPGEQVRALARFDSQREPGFSGTLLMETRGRTTEGGLAFLLVFRAEVAQLGP